MKHDAKQLGGLFTSDWLIQFALYDRVYWIPSKKPVLREKAFSIYMVICCSEGSCPDLAFFPLQKPIQGTKPNPQQGGEGTGAQRQFPAVWYNFLPLTWASSGTGVSKLGSHHPLYMAGTTFGLGDEQSEISLQLSQLLWWDDWVLHLSVTYFLGISVKGRESVFHLLYFYWRL